MLLRGLNAELSLSRDDPMDFHGAHKPAARRRRELPQWKINSKKINCDKLFQIKFRCSYVHDLSGPLDGYK